jgi:DNA-binding response OmpR family regulator
MVSNGPTPPPADTPMPNVPLVHRPGDVAAGPATLPRPPLVVRKRVLVVDDEPPVLKLLVRILSVDNYEIQSTDSGVAAAQLLQMPGFRGVDLLVTDVMMPQMNGRELAAVVRKQHPSARVLYVTGFADTLFKGVQELVEGESFIEKPFGAEGLLEAARLLMFGHIADGEATPDKRDSARGWADQRLRMKLIRLLKRLRFA